MHYLSIKDLNAESINKIFRMADKLKESPNKLLENKTFVLFFPESSIRTRLSFEKGIKDLGGQCVLFPPATLDKKEALVDVAAYIENWADAIVVRHKDYDRVCELAKGSNIPVINAMTSYNHPCEILSDLYAMSKIREDYRKLNYTFVGGDGNILNSWCTAAEVFDFQLNHVSPEDYKVVEKHKNYRFTTDLESVLGDSDVILTDLLPKELSNETYYEAYQISTDRMKMCKAGAVLNPCPPFSRGEEVSEDVIASEYFVGYGFKKNLIYVQQAIIFFCLGLNINE